MAELREMPRIRVELDKLMEWGRIWHGSEGSLRAKGEVPAKRRSCFDKRQAMEFGRVFDHAFGHALTADDLRRYGTKHRSKLIDLNGQPRASFSTALDAYVRSGEEQGVDHGYKCRIRNRWFDVPSVYVPDAFLFRQIHHAPLLAANHARATSTDTIHRVRVAAGVDVDSLCASMVNSLTFAWAEVCGRSYGGGVLELEPREAERLLVPYRFSKGLDVEHIDRRLRAGDLEGALDHGDSVLLKGGCGFSNRDVSRARAAWNRLRSRRHRRR